MRKTGVVRTMRWTVRRVASILLLTCAAVIVAASGGNASSSPGGPPWGTRRSGATPRARCDDGVTGTAVALSRRDLRGPQPDLAHLLPLPQACQARLRRRDLPGQLAKYGCRTGRRANRAESHSAAQPTAVTSRSGLPRPLPDELRCDHSDANEANGFSGSSPRAWRNSSYSRHSATGTWQECRGGCSLS